MNRLAYILRDTVFFNFIIRNGIRCLLGMRLQLEKIAARFRTYGVITLQIEGVAILCRTRADDFMANEIYYGTGYEPNEFRLIKILSRKSRRFVEVGSYTGIFSLFVARINSAIEVTCIEPHPNNFARIEENIRLNVLTNVTPRQLAAGDKDSSISLSIPKVERLSTVGSVNHEFSQVFHEAEHIEVEVEQVRLDSILAGKTLTSFDILKIDVEYYELNVLKGATEILRTSKPMLMVEIILSERLFYYRLGMKGKINERHALEVEELLRSFGYSPYQILSDGIYRIDSVINGPDTRNYLFVPVSTPQRFVPFESIFEFLQASA
jgi:FkbM family methyltransferase